MTTMTRTEFCQFLRETLIPDLRESGRDATADDFQTAINFIEGKDAVDTKGIAISVTVFDDPEKWLRENIADLCCDAVAAVYPLKDINLDGNTKYRDKEANKTKVCTLADHIKGLRLLCEQVGRTLFVGGIKNPCDLTDAGNWDVEVVDAYFQLVMYGETLYG